MLFSNWDGNCSLLAMWLLYYPNCRWVLLTGMPMYSCSNLLHWKLLCKSHSFFYNTLFIFEFSTDIFSGKCMFNKIEQKLPCFLQADFDDDDVVKKKQKPIKFGTNVFMCHCQIQLFVWRNRMEFHLIWLRSNPLN